MRPPTVTIVIPVRNEEHLPANARLGGARRPIVGHRRDPRCRRAIERSNPGDRRRVPGVRLIDNPERASGRGAQRRPRVASGDIIVRVDGHCVLAPDYVERCVVALERTGAAMVGGAMTPSARRQSASRGGHRGGDGEPARGRTGAVPRRRLRRLGRHRVPRRVLGPTDAKASRWAMPQDVGGERGCRVRDPHPRAGADLVRSHASVRLLPRSTVARWGGSSTGTAKGVRQPVAIPGKVRPRQLAAPPGAGAADRRRRAGGRSRMPWSSRPPRAAREPARTAIGPGVRRGPSRHALLVGRRVPPGVVDSPRRGRGARRPLGTTQWQRRSCRWTTTCPSRPGRYAVDAMPADARIFVAGHRGLVGSAVVRRLDAAGLHERPHRDARAARPARPGGGELLVPGQPARVRVPRRRHRRRHPGQLDAAGRVHLRQHDDPRHGGARQPPVRRARSCCTSAARASTRDTRRSRSPRRSC